MALFIWQNLKKSLTADQELWGCANFGPKMVHLPQTNIFWKKIIKIIFIYLLVPFMMQNFKIILKADPELLWCTIFGPKMAHLPKWEFFCRKPVKNPCSFHSCLSICQKSKSDIKLLMKYWRLNDTLIVLDLFSAITWEPDFFKACSFQRMFMNHMNFRFT